MKKKFEYTLPFSEAIKQCFEGEIIIGEHFLTGVYFKVSAEGYLKEYIRTVEGIESYENIMLHRGHSIQKYRIATNNGDEEIGVWREVKVFHPHLINFSNPKRGR